MTRVRWSDAEKGALGTYIWNRIRPRLESGEITLKQAKGGYQLMPLLREAMDNVLSVDRRRSVISVLMVPWLVDMIEQEAYRLYETRRRREEAEPKQPVAPEANGEVVEAPVVTAQLVPSTTNPTPGQLLDLLLESLGGSIAQVSDRLVSRLDNIETGLIMVAEMLQGNRNGTMPTTEEIARRVRNPKFAIVGIQKGTQITEVKNRFKHQPVNLLFCEDGRIGVPSSAETVFVMNRFVGHSEIEKLIAEQGKDRLQFVDGKINDLCHAIKTRLESVPKSV